MCDKITDFYCLFSGMHLKGFQMRMVALSLSLSLRSDSRDSEFESQAVLYKNSGNFRTHRIHYTRGRSGGCTECQRMQISHCIRRFDTQTVCVT